MNISSVAGSCLGDITSRVSGRLADISSRTGISFPDVFSQALAPEGAGKTETSSAASETEKSTASLSPVVSNNTDAALLLSNTLLGSDDALGTESSAGLENLTNQLMSAYNARIARQNVQQQTEVATAPTVASTAALPSGAKPEKYDALISDISAQYGVSPLLIRAIAFNESGFDPSIVAANGASGMMMLMPATVKDFDVENPLDPRENIDAGVRVLMGHIIRYDGDIKMALAAYNAGPGLLSKRGIENLDDPEQFAKLPAETRNYITKIEKYVSQYGYPDMLDVNFFGSGSKTEP